MKRIKTMMVCSMGLGILFASGEAFAQAPMTRLDCMNIPGYGSVIYKQECANEVTEYDSHGIPIGVSCGAWVTTDTWYGSGSCPGNDNNT